MNARSASMSEALNSEGIWANFETGLILKMDQF